MWTVAPTYHSSLEAVQMRVSSFSLGTRQLIGRWAALLGTCHLIGLVLDLVVGRLSQLGRQRDALRIGSVHMNNTSVVPGREVCFPKKRRREPCFCWGLQQQRVPSGQGGKLLSLFMGI